MRAAIALCCIFALGSSHGVSPGLAPSAPLVAKAHRSLVSAGNGGGSNGALTEKRGISGGAAPMLSLRGGEGSGDVVGGAGAALMGEKSNIVAAVASKVGVKLHNQEDHPLQIIKSWFFEHFAETHVGPRPARPPALPCEACRSSGKPRIGIKRGYCRAIPACFISEDLKCHGILAFAGLVGRRFRKLMGARMSTLDSWTSSWVRRLEPLTM